MDEANTITYQSADGSVLSAEVDEQGIHLVITTQGQTSRATVPLEDFDDFYNEVMHRVYNL